MPVIHLSFASTVTESQAHCESSKTLSRYILENKRKKKLFMTHKKPAGLCTADVKVVMPGHGSYMDNVTGQTGAKPSRNLHVRKEVLLCETGLETSFSS